MIPIMNIIAWGKFAPWAEQRQVEQDLIISRAIIETFKDPFLREELRFRGGTALHKIHFPEPQRYSEDIDLVRTKNTPIGPILDRLREVLEPWLGRAAFSQSQIASKLKFQVKAEDQSPAMPLNLKLEINTREADIFDKPIEIAYGIKNPWFSGDAMIQTFSKEEMLATKLRALLQRDRGRDLFDLSHALTVFDELDTVRMIAIFQNYLHQTDISISRAEAEKRMFAKLNNPGFLTDVRPLLSAKQAESLTKETMRTAFVEVLEHFITQLPGNPWVRTAEMMKGFGLKGG